MSLYFNTLVATEHRNELVRQAAVWRRRREAADHAAAKRAAARTASVAVKGPDAPVYCHRAAQRPVGCVA